MAEKTMRKYGFVGALQEEIDLLTNALENRKKTVASGFPVYEGKLIGRRVAIVCCGAGKINAAVCTSMLIRDYHCTHVINCGIAGAMGENVRPMDIVLGETVCNHDEWEVTAHFYPFKSVYEANQELLSAAMDACRTLKGDHGWHVGLIATGDQFIAGGEPARSIRERFHPLAVEMEGGALAKVAAMNNLPFLVIRTMSDSADENATESYDNFLITAANQSAKLVCEMLRELPV